MRLAENVPWAKNELAFMVRVRNLLRSKVNRIWAHNLVEADSQVSCTASVAILCKGVELSMIVHCTVMVDTDAAYDVLVRSVETLVIPSECRLLIDGVGQLCDAFIMEFYQFKRAKSIHLVLVQLQVIIEAGSISTEPFGLEWCAIADLAILLIYVKNIFQIFIKVFALLAQVDLDFLAKLVHFDPALLNNFDRALELFVFFIGIRPLFFQVFFEVFNATVYFERSSEGKTEKLITRWLRDLELGRASH